MRPVSVQERWQSDSDELILDNDRTFVPFDFDAEDSEDVEKFEDAFGLLKGDSEGHPFRGNQYTGEVGSSLYHATDTKNVASIRAKGLLPMQTSNWVQAGSGERYGGGDVFAFQAREDAVRWAAKMDWDHHGGMGTGKTSVVEFKVGPRDKWKKDTADPLGQASARGAWLRQAGRVDPKLIVGSRPVKTEDIRALTKGDVPGHPFHGNQYSEGMPESPEGMTRVKALGGSTGAILVRSGDGELFVRKEGNSPGHLREEDTADRVYRAAGVRVPDSRVYETEDGPVKLSRFIEGTSLDSAMRAGKADQALGELRRDFALDAALQHWDTVGLSRDNVVVDREGHAWRIDNGGALRYRAQGAPKKMSEEPTELTTLRDKSINPSMASVFGPMTQKEVSASIDRVVERKAAILGEIKDAKLRALIGTRIDNMKGFRKGDLPGHEFHGNQWTETQAARPEAEFPDPHATVPGWQDPPADPRYGGVLIDGHGRVLLREPAGHFGGYAWTFPKGGADEGEHPTRAALREVREETGRDAEIVGAVPGAHGSADSTSYFFLMQAKGSPGPTDAETSRTRWATPAEARRLIGQTPNAQGRERDLRVLDAATRAMRKGDVPGHEFHGNQYTDGGTGTDSPEFREWFGESRIVNDDGSPMRLFHGTDRALDSFDTNAGIGIPVPHAAYFSDQPAVADDVATMRGRREGAQVIPVYLKMERPLVLDAKGRHAYEMTAEVAAKLDRDEHDGVVIRNVREFQSPALSTTYAVFKPEQVKSAMGNRGTFSPGTSHIGKSRRSRAIPRALDELDARYGSVRREQAARLRASLAQALSQATGYDDLRERLRAAAARHRDGLAESLACALLDAGMTGRTVVRKGDLPGHEFHGNQWTHGALVAEGARQMAEGVNSHTLATLAYPGRRTEDGMSEIAHVANSGVPIASAVRAIDSQTEWGGGWAVASDEWRAAQALGGNGQMGKLTKEELAAPVDYRNKGELSPDDIKAFEARREWMQARFREQYGEEATFYRGVSGRYAGGLPDLREPNEVKTYALSSWTPRRSIANEFAKGSAGLVVATTIRASDVWLMPRRGVESPFRIADAKDEVVILNKGKTRTMRRP